jgi:hypothetical protein
MAKVGSFMIWLSGVDRPTLERCPMDRAKFQGIGGAVLTVAVLAAGSCTYALVVALAVPVPAAVCLGAMWGLAVGNLDRWFITAMRRRPSVRANIIQFLPRIVLSLLMSLVIAEPVLLRAFQREIRTELLVMQAQQEAAFQTQLNGDAQFRQIPADQARIATLEATVNGTVTNGAVLSDPLVKQLTQQVATTQAQYQAAQQAAICDLQGTCDQAGAGPVYDQKVAVSSGLGEQLAALNAQLQTAKDQVTGRLGTSLNKNQTTARMELATLQPQLASLQKVKAAEIEAHETATGSDSGLLARMEALNRYAAGSTTLTATVWILRLFIVAIDCVPVVGKLMMNLGPASRYEREVEGEEEMQCRLDDERRSVAEELALAEQRRQVSELKHSEGLQEEVARKRAELVVESQERLDKELLERWEAEQFRAIRAGELDDLLQVV